MTNAIVTQNQMPAMTIMDAIERYNAVVEFTKTVMKSGKDYGIVPGTDKPTLLKPGAEKLCTLFGLTPEFETADKITDFKEGLFYFQYRCKLSRNGQVVATGLGSCNSMEKKYRYRNVYANKATAEEKERAVRVETKQGRGGSSYTVYVLENTEPFDLINTIDKMAQKRALVAATLIGANASEFYTQDIEDMEIIEGVWREAEEPQGKPQTQNQPAPKTPAPTIKANGANGNGGEPLRFAPEELRDALNKSAIKHNANNAVVKDTDRNMIPVNLEACFPGDKEAEHKRKVFTNYIYGVDSTKDLDAGQITALKGWLKVTKDDGGAWHPDAMAVREAKAVYTAALKAEGQQELI